MGYQRFCQGKTSRVVLPLFFKLFGFKTHTLPTWGAEEMGCTTKGLLPLSNLNKLLRISSIQGPCSYVGGPAGNGTYKIEPILQGAQP